MKKIGLLVCILMGYHSIFSQVEGHFHMWDTTATSLCCSVYHLYPDNTYQYNGNTGLMSSFSVGKWKLQHDTLILNSKYQVNNWPIQVIEGLNHTNTDSVKFNVLHSDHTAWEAPQIRIIINGLDTIDSKPFPHTGSFTVPRSTPLTNFQIEYYRYQAHNYLTETYQVKNPKATQFDISVHFKESYLIFKDYKLRVKEDTLIQIKDHPLHGEMKYFYVKRKD